MSYRCQRCDEELTYALDSSDFEYGLLCDQCRARYDKTDDYRVWRKHQERRESYLEKRFRDAVNRRVDELLDD